MLCARLIAAAGRFRFALLLPFLLLKSAAAQDGRPAGPAELRNIEFEGASAFSDFALRSAIMSTTSGCKYLPLLGTCLFGRDRREVDQLALQGDVLRLRVFYYERGYREAKVTVDSTRAGDVMKVTFHITEGAPVEVRGVRIGGTDELDPAARLVIQSALEKLPLRAGKPLSLIDYESARDTLLNRLHNVGYGRSEVFGEYTIPRDSPYVAFVGFDLLPGNRVYLGAPNITNNQRVSSSVIRKMLAFRKGDLYTREAILRSQRNLFALEIFRNVDVHVDLAAMGDTVTPHIDVLEGSLNRFRVGAGVSTSEYINAEGRWIARDFLGGARRLEVRGRVTTLGAGQLGVFPWFETTDAPYDKPGGSLSLDVTQPWFFDAANSFGAGVFVERRSIPNVFVRTAQGGYIAATRALAPTATVTLGYRPERTRLDAEDLIFCVSFTTCEAADIRILRDPHWLAPLTATFARDASNSLFAPTRGSILRIEGEYAASATASEFGYTRIVGEWITYHEPMRGLVFATRVRPGWATSVNEPGSGLGLHPQKRFFAGGPNSVRGFGQYQLGPKLLKIDAEEELLEPGETSSGFAGCRAQDINAGECDVSQLAENVPERFELRPVGGAAAFEGNFELRFPVIGEKLRGAAFVDFGQVWSEAKDMRLSDLVWTPGAGLRYFSAIGPIRVDIGYNTQGRQQLSVLTNKLCLKSVDPCSPDSVKDGVEYTRDELRNSGTLTRLDDVAFGPKRWLTFDRIQLHFSIGQAF
jgi:outer membrane protein insertion porin family